MWTDTPVSSMLAVPEMRSTVTAPKVASSDQKQTEAGVPPTTLLPQLI